MTQDHALPAQPPLAVVTPLHHLPTEPEIGYTTAFSWDNLTDSDQLELLRYISSTKPAIGGYSDFESAVETNHLTPVALWQMLSTTTSIRLMIAAAALRYVTRCPDDPRLNPAPHAAAPVRRPKNEAERSRAARKEPTNTPSPGHVVLSIKENPKRKGTASYTRFALWQEGMTVEAARAAGISSADITWDTERGFVTWGPLPTDTNSSEEGTDE